MNIETDLRIIWPEGNGEDHGFIHKLDFIFIHGLNPTNRDNHGNRTWTSEKGTMWPKDLLPSRVDYARIILFEYNSNVSFAAAETDLRGHAESLLDSVHQVRRETLNTLSHPIIFVGHSLGGLIIKQALVLAKQNDTTYGEVLRATRSIVFFAVPHRGGNGTTIGDVVASAMSYLSGGGRNDLIKSLKKSSKLLAYLSADFGHQYEDYHFLSVIESQPLFRVPMNPIRTVVVDRSSAILGLPGHRERILEMNRDHRQICKFEEGPEFARLAMHLKSLAADAVRSVESADSPSIVSEVPVTLDDCSVRPVATKYSTLDQRNDLPLIGQRDLIRWLDYFVYTAAETCLVLHGSAGTGKSTATYQAALAWSQKMSVFWFCAESPRSIERGFKSISRLEYPRRQKLKTFRDWLSTDNQGPWVAIFDNAYSGLDLRGFFPKLGGKVIVTARHTDVWTGSGFARKAMPILRPKDAVELFVSRLDRGSGVPRETPQLPALAIRILEKLTTSPLSICFAAACVSGMSLDSAASHLQILEDENVENPTNLDSVTWKWGSHLLGNLDERDSYLLGLVCIFDGDFISDDFVDLISRDSRSSNIFNTRQYTGMLGRLLKQNLIQRCRNAVLQYYCVPLAIRECVIHYLTVSGQHGGVKSLVNDCCEIIISALTAAKLKSGDNYRKSLEVAYPHIQSICLTAKSNSCTLNDGLLGAFHEMCIVALKKATEDAEKFLFKQFWRTWLVNNNFPLNEANQGVDDGRELIVYPIIPLLNEESSGVSETYSTIRAKLCDLIVSTFVKDFRDAVMLVAMSMPWNSIKDEVFSFIRAQGNPTRDESQLDSILNFIDKGAAEGQLHAIGIMHLQYTREATETGATSLKDLIDIVTSAVVNSNVDFSNLTEDSESAVKLVLNDALKEPLGSSFFQMTGAFEDVLKGSVPLICNVLMPCVNGYDEPENFTLITQVMIESVVLESLRARIHLVSRGYWQVIAAQTLFFAADILRELSGVVKSFSVDVGKDDGASASLMTKSISLTRAAAMDIGNESNPSWEIAVAKTTFWCLQAEECRRAWSTYPGRDQWTYQSQDRWEEFLILSGFSKTWPISDIV